MNIEELKLSDVVGKHNSKEPFKKTYGEPPMVHGALVYRCEDCSEEWLMWLEEGVEGKNKIMPCPFMIACECGGFASHVDWDKNIELIELIPLKAGEKYFALDDEGGCGKPSIYMGKKKRY